MPMPPSLELGYVGQVSRLTRAWLPMHHLQIAQ
jgi:hypothetical protein